MKTKYPLAPLRKFRILKPEEKIQRGDCWYDFNLEKWWEFIGGDLDRQAKDYIVVARLK